MNLIEHLLRDLRGCARCGFFGVLVGLMALLLPGCDGPQLQPWHTEVLTAEFTADKVDEVQTFEDYRRLEERLFQQLEEKVYARTATGPAYKLVRYSKGSAADPMVREPNWNRSFELPVENPAGGVLLLHGMSDSPYSLRALGQALQRSGFWVIGLRLPGHGTAPSGLLSVQWEDMAAAVRLGAVHLAARIGLLPIHLVGYSNGGALALDYTLSALEGSGLPVPASLVLISPAVGVHPSAALAGWMRALSVLPGLGRLAWLSVEPEFDPFKYNSFPTNAGEQVHRITRSVSRRLEARVRSQPGMVLPPTLVLQSSVDATVLPDAVVDRLLNLLGPNGHELVLFDSNRSAAISILLVADPHALTNRLLGDDQLPFAVTIVSNQDPASAAVVAHRKGPFSAAISEIQPLNLAWPRGVISLSHVALPFPPDDPLYGERPPADDTILFLGYLPIQGERGLFALSSDWLLRLRHNPFYTYLEERVLAWIESPGGGEGSARAAGLSIAAASQPGKALTQRSLCQTPPQWGGMSSRSSSSRLTKTSPAVRK